MYEGIATGRNENYGKEGEKILFADSYLRYVKRDKIATKIKYAGSDRLVIRDAKTNEEIR